MCQCIHTHIIKVQVQAVFSPATFATSIGQHSGHHG